MREVNEAEDGDELGGGAGLDDFYSSDKPVPSRAQSARAASTAPIFPTPSNKQRDDIARAAAAAQAAASEKEARSAAAAAAKAAAAAPEKRSSVSAFFGFGKKKEAPAPTSAAAPTPAPAPVDKPVEKSKRSSRRDEEEYADF